MRIPGYLGLAAALWLFSQSGWTFDRQVVVNGTHLGPTELAWLDALNGGLVPDGRYWLDLDSGAWGYEGGPTAGVLGQEEDAGTPGNAGQTGYFEDEVADFCARNGGCPW